MTLAPSSLSAAGESCEAGQDCAEGLSCVDLVCMVEEVGGPSGDAGPAAALQTRSGSGESCTRRADCEVGLFCFEQTCFGEKLEVLQEGPRKGSHGESCVVSNDCELGMGCFALRCAERDLLLAPVEKECHRVECVAEDDCCKDFVPEDTALCAELDVGCKAGIQSECNLYASICSCSRICEDGVCIASVACENDLDCGGSGVLRCFAGKCAQCGSDTDCSGQAACVSGLCRAGCERNEQCPIFSVCLRHQCEHVGCQSDRECFFDSGSARSKCAEGDCRTPCESDAACPLAFHACIDGLCGFVGCESDEECRAALQLGNQSVSSPIRAVCRLPEE